MAKKKAEKTRTNVLFILDKSGSMGSTKAQVITGFNEQLQQLQKKEKEGENLGVSLITFDGDVFENLWNAEVADLKPASAEDYEPDGSTALHDAIGYGLQKMLDTTNRKEDDYLVFIITDGGENASHYYNQSQVRELIDGCRATKRWTITYMGCSERELKEVAQNLHIPVANAALWNNMTREAATRGSRGRTNKTRSYFEAKSAGNLNPDLFYSPVAGTATNFCDSEKGAIVSCDVAVPEASELKQMDYSVLAANLPNYASNSANHNTGYFANTGENKVSFTSKTNG